MVGSVPVMASVSGDIIYCPNRFSVAGYAYPIAKSNRDMKKYQFEEITFWLSLIACLMAWIDVKRKRKNYK
mgnify:FL=1